MEDIRMLIVIPARGNSRGLLRKNLLPIHGTPAVIRSAQAAAGYGRVVVSTDDPEIASLVDAAGFEVHRRGPELAEVTVDRVVEAVVADLQWDGEVLLLQPTVQPITGQILTDWIERARGDTPVSAVVDDRHQLWRDGWLTERVNRQHIQNPLQREVGIRWWPAGTVCDIPQRVCPIRGSLVDIDTPADYLSVAQKPADIVIWIKSDREVGSGHLRRQLAIAERLQHHRITWNTDDCDPATTMLLRERGWRTAKEHADPDIWILDRLDNSDMPHLPGRVVTFEDQSSYPADVTINALYGTGDRTGADWCVLRPEFTVGCYTVRDRVSRIMVMFGGTDPHNIGERVAKLFPVEATLIRAGDNIAVAATMRNHDLLITSAGRTVFEAAAVGIPTIVLAQNLREETHTHLGAQHGNVYLGSARLVHDDTLRHTVDMLDRDLGYRRELSETGKPDGLGLSRIVHEVEGLLVK